MQRWGFTHKGPLSRSTQNHSHSAALLSCAPVRLLLCGGAGQSARRLRHSSRCGGASGGQQWRRWDEGVLFVIPVPRPTAALVLGPGGSFHVALLHHATTFVDLLLNFQFCWRDLVPQEIEESWNNRHARRSQHPAPGNHCCH